MQSSSLTGSRWGLGRTGLQLSSGAGNGVAGCTERGESFYKKHARLLPIPGHPAPRFAGASQTSRDIQELPRDSAVVSLLAEGL